MIIYANIALVKKPVKNLSRRYCQASLAIETSNMQMAMSSKSARRTLSLFSTQSRIKPHTTPVNAMEKMNEASPRAM